MTATVIAHPAWCDPDRCTAAPAATSLSGYRAGAGGQHRSAPIRFDLRGAMWLLAQDATARLTEAVALWACEPFLRVRLGDAELSKVSARTLRLSPILDELDEADAEMVERLAARLARKAE